MGKQHPQKIKSMKIGRDRELATAIMAGYPPQQFTGPYPDPEKGL